MVSKDDRDGIEVLLEPAPLHFKPSRVFQDAPLDAEIPYTQLDVDSVDDEFKRLTNLGVEFIVEPKVYDTVKYTVLNDTCGNNIQTVENL